MGFCRREDTSRPAESRETILRLRGDASTHFVGSADRCPDISPPARRIRPGDEWSLTTTPGEKNNTIHLSGQEDSMLKTRFINSLLRK